MKNKSILLLALCLCLALCGCRGSASLPGPEPVTVETPTAVEPQPMDNTLLFSYEGKVPKTMYQYYSENPDTIGWLKIPNTKTDNIVMLGQKRKAYPIGSQGQNHYLDYSFYHARRTAGELYIDHRCRITPDFLSQNMTIYGHHMRNGTMLAEIDRYKQESYFHDHPYFMFQTLWDTYYFKVFGVFTVNLLVPEDANFDYRQPNYGDGFADFIKEVKNRSYYDTGVDVPADSKIISLSTCTYPTGNPAVDDARLVVMGRICTDPKEIEEAKQHCQ